jgi:hypothetical protein
MDWKDKLTTWGGIAAIAALFLTVCISSFNRLDADVKLIYQDMKDFHGRLCAIEERNKK